MVILLMWFRGGMYIGITMNRAEGRSANARLILFYFILFIFLFYFILFHFILDRKCYQVFKPEMEIHMINIIYAAVPMREQTEKTIFSCKTLRLYWSGARDMFIDKAHTALGVFPVFFPYMLPSPLCGIFLSSR